ncbi:uncharacterized protein LTR77_008958 [Saxophila tyrrhenica]|uniref:UPF3 domain-containing protein n=1 Tax=Saxophila tyrrhenica TaxID=1690608 RepID=A0AAV9NZR6_9PEZI|nr:hypothetical protein LTR77_008958 [Saxophila tyrrhenica]
MPPKVIARNADRQGGVLPVNAAVRAGPAKTQAPRLKLEVRRLPPGLTLTEFEETLGDEWKLNNGKVDWREYRQGKTRLAGSGKVPEQSRCYIHLASEPYVKEFEKRFLEVTFQDKAGTHKNPDLKHLAPTLGFAPNQRTPLQQLKQRTDNRQGTIDQDPEFIAFLEAETQPITKAYALDVAHQETKAEKAAVKTTPLIEDLREKKANKAKAAQAKAEKVEQDKKAAKAGGKAGKAAEERDAAATTQQQKVEQAAKEAGRVANRQAAAVKQAQQAKAVAPLAAKKQKPSPKPTNATSNPSAAASGPPSPAPQRAPAGPRQRGNADGIKKMLQKDLGIKPKAAPPTPSTAPSASTTTSPPSTASTPAAPATSAKQPPSKAPTTPQASSDQKPSPPKAYLKHANPSQGMTEILIQQALSQYGDMASVTIDPRKGTAIALFKDSEGLKKALEAKRVPVANGAVEVLEFREIGTRGSAGRGGFRGGRGGRVGARGGAQGSAAASPAPAASSAG